jgi:hypothetical protein
MPDPQEPAADVPGDLRRAVLPIQVALTRPVQGIADAVSASSGRWMAKVSASACMAMRNPFRTIPPEVSPAAVSA